MDEKFFFKKKHLFWLFILVCCGLVFYKIRSVLLPFYIAFFVTILFNGVVNFFEKKFRIPRVCTSGIITVMICTFLAYITYLLFQITFLKATSLSVDKFASSISRNISNHAGIIDDATMYFTILLEKYSIHDVLNIIANQCTDMAIRYTKYFIKNTFNYSSNIFGSICLLALTPIIMFMMLKDMPTIKKHFYSLLPVKIKKETRHLLDEIHESVFKYLEGQTLAAIVLSVLYALMLIPIGVNHFIILGIIIGFSSFVPYIGFYLATAITLISVYTQFYEVKTVIITLVAMLLLQVVDSGFITPKIVGSKLGVHPLAVIFGVLISVPLFGFFGILLALPLIGIANIIGRFLIKKYKNSSYYNDEIV